MPLNVTNDGSTSTFGTLNFRILASSICFDKTHVHCEIQNWDLNSESRFNQFKNSWVHKPKKDAKKLHVAKKTCLSNLRFRSVVIHHQWWSIIQIEHPGNISFLQINYWKCNNPKNGKLFIAIVDSLKINRIRTRSLMKFISFELKMLLVYFQIWAVCCAWHSRLHKACCMNTDNWSSISNGYMDVGDNVMSVTLWWWQI